MFPRQGESWAFGIKYLLRMTQLCPLFLLPLPSNHNTHCSPSICHLPPQGPCFLSPCCTVFSPDSPSSPLCLYVSQVTQTFTWKELDLTQSLWLSCLFIPTSTLVAPCRLSLAVQAFWWGIGMKDFASHR